MTYSDIPIVGISLTPYIMNFVPIRTAFYDVPGVYVFGYLHIHGGWNLVYIGETHSFKKRIDQEFERHHHYKCIMKHGATHVGSYRVLGGKQARVNIETDIRNNYPETPCNLQKTRSND